MVCPPDMARRWFSPTGRGDRRARDVIQQLKREGSPPLFQWHHRPHPQHDRSPKRASHRLKRGH